MAGMYIFTYDYSYHAGIPAAEAEFIPSNDGITGAAVNNRAVVGSIRSSTVRINFWFGTSGNPIAPAMGKRHSYMGKKVNGICVDRAPITFPISLAGMSHLLLGPLFSCRLSAAEAEFIPSNDGITGAAVNNRAIVGSIRSSTVRI